MSPWNTVEFPHVTLRLAPEILDPIDVGFVVCKEFGVIDQKMVTRLVVRDFIAGQGKLYVQASKTGRERFVTLSDEARDSFTVAADEKSEDALLFCHEDGKAWKKAPQTRRLKDICKAAEIEPAISFHILRHTHASHLAMNRTPLPVIAAQLGHSDTRMVEKHYAHLAPSYVSDAIRDGMPSFNI